MAGLITHLAVSLIGALVIFFIFYKSRFKGYYCFSFILGNLISDIVDFGITGFRVWSVTPYVIMNNDWFNPLARFSHNFWHWVIIAVVIMAFVFVLFKMKKASKSIVIATAVAIALFLIGVIIHINLDFFIIEKSPWI